MGKEAREINVFLLLFRKTTEEILCPRAAVPHPNSTAAFSTVI
jgi:hypothetical protein